MSFTFVNFIPSQRSTVTSKFMRRSSDLNTNLGGGYTQASITFFNSGVPALRVAVLPSHLQGRRSNFLKFGLYRQAGVRYIMTLYEDDNDKLDGTVSTAGHELGATTAAAVVAKINSSALKAFISAELINDYANIDYTGAAGITAGYALPMTGGRG